MEKMTDLYGIPGTPTLEDFYELAERFEWDPKHADEWDHFKPLFLKVVREYGETEFSE
ncbi:MAG: hypothetical protein ACE5FT_00985 [Candidatus Nanoarchaeia archaeon]